MPLVHHLWNTGVKRCEEHIVLAGVLFQETVNLWSGLQIFISDVLHPMSKGQSFGGDALWRHHDSTAGFCCVFCWGVESQHFFAQRRRPDVLLGRNRQLCEPWQTMLSLSWIHVKTWLGVEKWSFSKDGSTEQSYASFSASGCKGADFFGLEMHSKHHASASNSIGFGAVEGLITVFQLRASAASHASYASHASQFVPRTAQSEQLGKSYHHLYHLYPFITLSSVVFDIIAFNWGLQVTMDSVCNRVSALPIQARWLLRSSANMNDIERPGRCLPSTLICHLWGTATVCRAHNCRHTLRFALGSAFVMCVMRSMKNILSKHLRPTAMPHPQTQLPLLVAYFAGSFFFEDPKPGTE